MDPVSRWLRSPSIPPGFIARVELHKLPQHVDEHPKYAALHAAMKAYKFTREIEYNGQARILPHATYYRPLGVHDSEALSDAQHAIESVKEEYKLLFARSAEITILGTDIEAMIANEEISGQ